MVYITWHSQIRIVAYIFFLPFFCHPTWDSNNKAWNFKYRFPLIFIVLLVHCYCQLWPIYETLSAALVERNTGINVAIMVEAHTIMTPEGIHKCWQSFMRFKDSFDGITQHSATLIDESQNPLLLTTPNQRRLPGRATWGCTRSWDNTKLELLEAAYIWQVGWGLLASVSSCGLVNLENSLGCSGP
jgi:hypothetical protein